MMCRQGSVVVAVKILALLVIMLLCAEGANRGRLHHRIHSNACKCFVCGRPGLSGAQAR